MKKRKARKIRKTMMHYRYWSQLILCCLLGLMISVFSTTYAAPPAFSATMISKLASLANHQVQASSVQRWLQTLQQSTTHSTQATHRRASLMILLSSSVPIHSVHHYLLEANKVKATLVLRGLVHNSFKQTAHFVHQLLGGVKGGIKIDPIVFEKLHITKVPAIVLANAQGLACLNQRGCIPASQNIDIVFGNVTLAYALAQMAADGSADPALAKHILATLRKHTHD